jgi:hypothetical protein
VDFNYLWPLACVFGVPAFMIYQTIAYDRSMRRQRLAIHAQFNALHHESTDDARSAYAGLTAVVVHEFDDEPKVGHRKTIHHLTIHRVFRNQYGEYFLFISGDPPYVTHLSRERAMNAMREDKHAFEREFGGTP